MKKVILIALVIFGSSFLSSCKTAEDVRREKDLSTQMDEHNRNLSENAEKLNNLQNEVARISGSLEEMKNAQTHADQGLEERVSSLESRLDAIQGKQEEFEKIIKDLSDKLSSGASIAPSSSNGKKNSKSETKTEETELKAGLDFFKKKKFTEAKEKLLPALDGKLSSGKKNQAQYALGVIEYENKDYERSLLYMGKLYAKYPSSSQAPGALLYMGKSLMALGKKVEAKESLQELVNNHEKAKEVAEAKKLLKGLK